MSNIRSFAVIKSISIESATTDDCSIKIWSFGCMDGQLSRFMGVQAKELLSDLNLVEEQVFPEVCC